MDSRNDQESGGFGEGIDLRHYWNVIKKRKWIMLATIVIVASLTTVMAMRQPRIYRASASVIVEAQAPKVLGGETVEVQQLGQGAYSWDPEEFFNTQERILSSRSLAEQVVRKFKLQNDPRLFPGAAMSASEEDRIESATGMVRGLIRVRMIDTSRVMLISINHTDPSLCRDLANHVADVYVEQNLAEKHKVTRRAGRWVAEQLDLAKKDLGTSETALYQFRKDHEILSLSIEDQRNQVSKDLETFSTALSESKKKRIDLVARRNALATLIKDGGEAAPSSYFAPSTTIEQLRSAYISERSKLRVLEERYDAKHPELIAQKARVAAQFKDLVDEVNVMLRSLDGEIKAVAEAEAKYAAEKDRLTKEAVELTQLEGKYKQLTRDQKDAEEMYALLLRRLNESGLEEQDFANNIRILDEARAPGGPISPNVRRSAMVGLALGFMLAFGLAFLIEFLDRTVKSQSDIETVAGLPFLGMVPSVVGPGDAPTPELFIAKNPTSTVAECCRVVRTNIQFCSADKPLRTMVVTSSNPVEGKTLNVVQLGIVMAQNGHRTLLVDTDMRRPRLHKAMKLSNENGVSRVLVGESDLDSAIKTTDVPNLYALPCGPLPPNPAELLQTERFAALVQQLGEKFDRVIFDSPPVLAVTDSVVLSRLVDGTVLVVRAGQTSRDALMRSKQALRNVGTQITGVVLNDVNLKNPAYAGYYNYYHYQYHEAPAASGTSKS